MSEVLWVMFWIWMLIFIYLGIGGVCAKLDAPAQWKRVRAGGRESWDGYGRSGSPKDDMAAQRDVANGMLMTVLLWPGRALWLLTYRQGYQWDPLRDAREAKELQEKAEREAKELQKTIDERQREIEKMERQLSPSASPTPPSLDSLRMRNKRGDVWNERH